MAQQQKEFAKGLFVNKNPKIEGFIDISIKKDDFVNFISNLEANEKGYVKFNMATQKNDPSKYSVWVNNWKPEGQAKPKAQPATSEAYDNDLPF